MERCSSISLLIKTSRKRKSTIDNDRTKDFTRIYHSIDKFFLELLPFSSILLQNWFREDIKLQFRILRKELLRTIRIAHDYYSRVLSLTERANSNSNRNCGETGFPRACEKCLHQSDRCGSDEFAAEKTTGAKGGSNTLWHHPVEDCVNPNDDDDDDKNKNNNENNNNNNNDDDGDNKNKNNTKKKRKKKKKN